MPEVKAEVGAGAEVSVARAKKREAKPGVEVNAVS